MAEAINVVAFVRVAADKVAEALPHVTVLVEESRKEAGIEFYDVYSDVQQPGTYVFIERYSSLDVLKKHQETEHFKNTIATCSQWFTAPLEVRILKKEL